MRLRRREYLISRSVVAVIGLIAISTCYARILRTRIPPSRTWDPGLPFTFGSGVEFETTREKTEIEFPMLLEYNFTQTLKLTVEPNFVYIAPKVQDVRRGSAIGDLETSLEYEFISERRYRPGFTAIGVVKWPTAGDPAAGSLGRDYSLGFTASKDLVFLNVDLSALYTFVGDTKERDAIELSAAAEWHLNHFFDIEGEIVHSFGAGGIRGRPGSISGIGSDDRGIDLTAGTLGVAWRATKRFKLEQGAVLRSNGTWQIVFAWEFSFSGD